MFCKNCGKEINDNAAVCIHCGVAIGNAAPSANKATSVSTGEKQSNIYSVVGLVLSFFIPLAGLIISIIACVKSKQYGGSGKGLAIGGIVVGAVLLLLRLILNIVFLNIFGIISTFIGIF